MHSSSKKYYIDPFGCAKNQVDAETMMAFLEGAGWISATADEADVVIVNSCGFVESAKRESINAVLEWRKAYPNKRIVLAGCLSQRYAEELREALPEADALFGNEDLSRISAAALGNEAAISLPAETALYERPLLSPAGSAYVKISEGCDNRCSFCSIPLIRGALKSRSIPDVAAECHRLLERGVKELCLIAQDAGAFGMDRGSAELPALLEEISRIDGDFWVRLLYIHPDHFPHAILPLMQRDKRFLPYFDLPFQHGSPRILRAMNRKKSAEDHLSLIETIRAALPDAVIRSTFLVGFPGETDVDMEALLDFQEKAALDWAGCFAYSREEDTAAYVMKNRVPKKTALARKRLVEERQSLITEQRMERFIGRTLDALVEEKIEGEDLYLGRLFCHAPEVDGATVISTPTALAPGAFVKVRVFSRALFDLEAAPI